MNARGDSANRATHRIASEINRVLAAESLTIAELAGRIGESERYIRSLLEGENGLPRRISVDLLVRIGDVADMDVTFRFTKRRVKTRNTVKKG